MHQDPPPGREPLHVTVTLTEALGSSVQVGFTFPGTPVDETRLGSGLADDDDEDITRLGVDGIAGVATFPSRSDVHAGSALTVHGDTEHLNFFDVETGRALR